MKVNSPRTEGGWSTFASSDYTRMTMLRIATLLTAALALGACATYAPYDQQASPNEYVVQPGDNIHSIAFLFVTTPQQLQLANPRIDTARLQPGMRLKRPGGEPAPSAIVRNTEETYTADTGPVRAKGFIWPLRTYQVSSGFGRRWGGFHAGIDLRAPKGTPIRAAADGRVVFAGARRGYGRMVVIRHSGGIETVYAHNSHNLVQQGQQVRKGETIGRVGRTGHATGYHVHFEVRRKGRPVDPVRQIQAAL